MHAAAFCKVFTCHRSLYDRIHMSCITIRIMIATFTPVVADSPLLLSRDKFNPVLGQIYPRATFTPAWCIRGMSFFKFTPAIPLGLVQTSGWCTRPLTARIRNSNPGGLRSSSPRHLMEAPHNITSLQVSREETFVSLKPE